MKRMKVMMDTGAVLADGLDDDNSGVEQVEHESDAAHGHGQAQPGHPHVGGGPEGGRLIAVMAM